MKKLLFLFCLVAAFNNAYSQCYLTDVTPPVAVCQDITVYLDLTGNAVIDSSDLDNGSSDNCGIRRMTLSKSTFNCSDLGANSVTLTVSDTAGNVHSCVSTVTIADNTSPNPMCKSVSIFLPPSGNISPAPIDMDNGSSDNCGIVNYSLSQTDFNCTHIGSNLVTLTVTDVSGNNASCAGFVYVYDLISPVANCKDDTVYLGATGTGSNTVADIDNGSSDNCSFSMSLSRSSYTCSNLGVNPVSLFVTDAGGNLAVCSASVTVLDTTSPMAICQDVTVSLDAFGNATVLASQVNNVSTDNCGIVNYSLSQTNFTCANVGANPVVLTVTDASGNSSTCNATVTVNDNTNPIARCQAVTIYLNASGAATIDSSDVDNGSTDNCGIATITLSQTAFDCTHTGSNTVAMTVTDVNGNSSNCSATVTVRDITSPTAMCKSDTVYLGATGTGSNTVADINNGSSDNCTFSMALSNTTYSCTEIGLNPVTLTATDASGNSNSCSSIVTVMDTTSPMAICQDVTVSLDAFGYATVSASQVNNGSTDNCGIVNYSLSQTNFTCTNVGANPVVLTVTDASGNSSTCNATVTVNDNTNPIARCQAVTIYLDASGAATIDSSDVDNGSTDNCGIATMALSQYNFNCGDAGMNTVTMTVTDVNGNVSSCMSMVNVMDTTRPMVSCMDTTIYLGLSNSATIDLSFVLNGATDNCSIDSTWLSKTNFSCTDLGVNKVMVIARDENGNIGYCVSTVTLLLQNAPTPSTMAVQVDKYNFAQVCLSDNRLLGQPNTYISCKAPTKGNLVNLNDTCFTYTQTSGTKFLDTACIIICDDCGICDTTTVIFVPTPDSETIVVGPVVPVTNVDTCVALESTFMNAKYVGTCDGSGTSSNGVPVSISGLCVRYPVPSPIFTGDNVCIIVCDTILNVTICDTTTIVYSPDVTPPTVICKNETVYLNSFGTVSIDTSNVLGSVFDNTLVNSVWLSRTMFSCANVGQNNVTVFARDTNRNMANCVAVVTVLDTISPTTLCKNITVQLDNTGTGSIIALDIDNGSFDNCGIASMVLSQSNFDCSHLGTNTVTLTITDIHGNSSVCSSVVTVEDIIPPVVFCRGDRNITLRNTTCTYVVEDFLKDITATDNCSPDDITYTQDPMPGIEVIIDNTSLPITVTTTDGSGNMANCSFNVVAICVKALDIPQFISPDFNGKNDTWEIPELAKYPENVVKVFNRWGNLVFEQKGYFTGWDGSTNVNSGVNRVLDNKVLPDGTYYYIIDLGDDGFEPYTGYLQLKR